MALQKQSIPVNFGQGLDTKTDPFQVQLGKFEALTNSVFDVQGRITKRNGFANITKLPDANQTTLTTLNDNLLATGSNLFAYSKDTDQWIDQGLVQPVTLDILPLVRVSTSQTSPDTAVSASGVLCLAYVDNGAVYFQVSDSTTGQQILSRQLLAGVGASPRVYLLGRYFIITFLANISGSFHLRYAAISTVNPAATPVLSDITTSLVDLNAGYDGYVANNSLYIGWADTGNVIKIAYISPGLVTSAPVVITGHTATLMSVTADESGSTPIIWISFWDSSSMDGYSAAYSQTLASVLAPTQTINNVVINEMTSVAQNSVLILIYENDNDYASPYPVSNVKTDFVSMLTVEVDGTVSAPSVIRRSVGLASKAFIGDTGNVYFLAAYGEANQPTYFLLDINGAIYMKLAYSNGGGYAASQNLPNVSVLNSQYLIPYLANDFLASVNKGTNNPAGTPVNAIYTQTGVNLAKFTINTSGQYSSEIAGTLNLTGGQIWEYDGVRPVELGFHIWPENIAATTSSTGGNLLAQKYYYAFCYEWTNNQGNLERSAPSIPILVTTTGTTSKNTLYVPTERLSYKDEPNPIRIVGYRWSDAQQVYYQFTSLTSPTINNPIVDYVVITDTFSDAAILGNTLLYTTGGVVENIAPPASIASALFKNRLFLVSAEDRNLVWYSKQVIEAVPVEMSDLLTFYVAPTSGAQGSTGPITALSAMDDKLIIFKSDAIYYVTGNGPDSTGANNDFSEPIFITSSVGCGNPNSIVLMPQGLMFQSDKGIWLLGRDLATNYIGAPVEAYNSLIVKSAQAIPATNQVRFIIDNNVTLMYDYYFQQWGTFTNIQAISATLYQGKHTYLNEFGRVFQESPGIYTDGSVPVLMNFKTSWVNIAGLQGFQRFYFMYLLGTYITPFKLNLQLAYDYNENASQNIQVMPDNYTPGWGGEALWGSSGPWGGPGKVFEARIFPQVQKCESFQISVNEIYDSTFNVPAGAGLTLSGLNIVVGAKKGYRTQKASRSFG